AAHHVENPREVVSQGDPVNVLILEIDGERRRLSLSLKRVEDDAVPVPRADGGESVHATPDLKLSEEAFPAGGAVATPEADEEETAEAVADEAEVEDDAEVEAAAELAEDEIEAEPAAEAADAEPVAEASEPEAADPEPESDADDSESDEQPADDA
ncbi:MAG TPA: S1 RNA-binding domain-containing protein, partial [Gaiella sp.]|nr:S1 RNA-binding domain-containing protein [Gaiella sp.]